MKKIIKTLALVSVVAIIMLAFTLRTYASTSFVLTPIASASSEANATSAESNTNINTALTLGVGNSIPTSVSNNTTNETANSTNSTKSTTNLTINTVKNVSANNINENIAKEDIPQTGENDLYIISTVGLIAITIGAISFVKSRK